MKSFAVIGALLHVAHGLADADCSESPGSCTARRSSLLQLRSLQKKTNAETSMRSKLAGFQHFTEKMIAKFGQVPDGSGVDTERETDERDFEEALPAVRLVLEFIHNMSATLLGYHNQDVTKVEQCSLIYENCVNEHLNESVNSSIHGLQSDWVSANQSHVQCRDDRKAIEDQETAACILYDTYRKTNDSALLPPCVGNKGPEADAHPRVTNAFYSEYVQANAVETSSDRNLHCETFNGVLTEPECNLEKDRLATMETCLEDTKDWLYPLWEKYQGCTRNPEVQCNDKRVQCTNDQHDFEEKHCTWLTKVMVTCTNIYHCVTGEESNCETICAGVEEDAAARAADNETGRRLECLLGVLFGERNYSDTEGTGFNPRLPPAERQAALNECKNAMYDTSPWDLECPTGWQHDHTQFENLSFSCACDQPVSDELDFLTQYYYQDPPDLGQICTANEEQGLSPFSIHDARACCAERRISTPWGPCNANIDLPHCNHHPED